MNNNEIINLLRLYMQKPGFIDLVFVNADSWKQCLKDDMEPWYFHENHTPNIETSHRYEYRAWSRLKGCMEQGDYFDYLKW